MNKKAIMVNFLVTVVIAILVFGSASVIIAKVLGVDEQGKKNFFRLHQELLEFAKDDKPVYSYLLILDKNTYVAKFDANKDINVGKVYGIESVFLYPKTSCKEKDCLVLCRKVIIGGERKNDVQTDFKFSCEEAVTIELDSSLKLHPFVVDRGVMDPSTPGNRRIFLNFYKDESDKINAVPLGQVPGKKMVDAWVKLIELDLPLFKDNLYSLIDEGGEDLFVKIKSVVGFSDSSPDSVIKGEARFLVNKKPARTDPSFSRIIFNNPKQVYDEADLLTENEWIFVKLEDGMLQPYQFLSVEADEKLATVDIVTVLTRASPHFVQEEKWYFDKDTMERISKLVTSQGGLLVVEYNPDGERKRSSYLSINEKMLRIKDESTQEEFQFTDGTPEYTQTFSLFDNFVVGMLTELQDSFNPPLVEKNISEASKKFKEIVYPFTYNQDLITNILLNREICGCQKSDACHCEICLNVEAKSISSGRSVEEINTANNNRCISTIITS